MFKFKRDMLHTKLPSIIDTVVPLQSTSTSHPATGDHGDQQGSERKEPPWLRYQVETPGPVPILRQRLSLQGVSASFLCSASVSHGCTVRKERNGQHAKPLERQA
jgi:hypothetical protein